MALEIAFEEITPTKSTEVVHKRLLFGCRFGGSFGGLGKSRARKRGKSWKASCRPELLFDPNQLIVFCDAIRAAFGARFFFPSIFFGPQIGDKKIFCFS